jgi:hypothetical protein
MMKIKDELQISDEQLVKVDTKDFDDMEKVSCPPLYHARINSCKFLLVY